MSGKCTSQITVNNQIMLVIQVISFIDEMLANLYENEWETTVINIPMKLSQRNLKNHSYVHTDEIPTKEPQEANDRFGRIGTKVIK